MTVTTLDRGDAGALPNAVRRPAPGWFNRTRGAVIRHGVINLFMLIILLPLAWVLLLSVKSIPDAMRSDLWPRRFDFTYYSYVFQRIATLPVNLFNSIYVTSFTVLITTVCAVLAGYALVHLKPRGSVFVVTVLLVSLYFPAYYLIASWVVTMRAWRRPAGLR